MLKPGEVIFENFNGYWNKKLQSPSLKEIYLFFERGVFYGITGKVGSGKSGLLGVILGEIPYYSGRFESNGSISYVEQEPIIFSDSVRNNILFGKAYDEEFYSKVVHDSCLIEDFENFHNGDLTIVG